MRDDFSETLGFIYDAPRGLHEGLRLYIRAGGGWIEDISLLRSWSAGAYTAGEIDIAT